MKLALWMAASLALGGCTVGPDYVRPVIATPASYAGTSGLVDAISGDPDAGFATWWTRLGDPVLDELVRRALADNPDLHTALSRVREARLNERVTAAAALPSVSAIGNVVDLNTGGAPLGGIALPGHTSVYAAGFDASWEIDLFGANRRAVEAARANTAAAEWTSRDGQVSLAAEVVSDYLGLRVLQSRIALGRMELQRQHDQAALIGARRQSGLITQTNVNQQTQVLENVAVEIPQLEAEAQVEIHALGVLAGQPPAYLAATLQPTGGELPVARSGLPLGLPSDLLRRRPDIRAAERRLAAANAMIGVRTAALYPRLNLLALASFGSTALGSLFASQNLIGAGVGMVNQPIFNGGRTRAAIGIARQDQSQARDAWQTTVLGAFRDVENALSRYNAETSRRADLERAAASADSELSIAQSQYRAGLVTQSNVLTAQITLLNDHDKLVQSKGQALVDLVALYKALGGGWTEQTP
jgi:NodT family efflux transporter outer membrane factor (OMF) lipoprotein